MNKAKEQIQSEEQPPPIQEQTRSFKVNVPQQTRQLHQDDELEKELSEKAEAHRERQRAGEGMPDERIISPQKLKDLFDKMTEIDTNPRGRASKEFQDKMSETDQQ